MLLRRMFWSLISRLEGLLWKELVFCVCKPPSIAFVNADVDAYDVDLKGDWCAFSGAVPPPRFEPQLSPEDGPAWSRSLRSLWAFVSDMARPAAAETGDTSPPLPSLGDEGDKRVVHRSLVTRPLLAPTLLSLLHDAQFHELLPCLGDSVSTIESHPQLTEELLAIASCGDARVRAKIVAAAANYRLRWESALHKTLASGVSQIVVSGWPWTPETLQTSYRASTRDPRNVSHESLGQLLCALGLTSERLDFETRAALLASLPDASTAICRARAAIFQHSFLDALQQLCVGSDISLQVLGHLAHPNNFTKHSTLPRLSILRASARFVLRTAQSTMKVVMCVGSANLAGLSVSCDLHKRWAWPLLCAARDHSPTSGGGELGDMNFGRHPGHVQENTCEHIAEILHRLLKRERWSAAPASAVSYVFFQARTRNPFVFLLFSALNLARHSETFAINGEFISFKNFPVIRFHPSRIIPLDIVLDGARKGRRQPWLWQSELPGRMRSGRLLCVPSRFPDRRWPIFLSSLLSYILHWNSPSTASWEPRSRTADLRGSSVSSVSSVGRFAQRRGPSLDLPQRHAPHTRPPNDTPIRRNAGRRLLEPHAWHSPVPQNWGTPTVSPSPCMADPPSPSPSLVSPSPLVSQVQPMPLFNFNRANVAAPDLFNNVRLPVVQECAFPSASVPPAIRPRFVEADAFVSFVSDRSSCRPPSLRRPPSSLRLPSASTTVASGGSSRTLWSNSSADTQITEMLPEEEEEPPNPSTPSS